MEILEFHVIETVPWYVYVCLLGVGFFALGGVLCLNDDCPVLGAFLGLGAVICIIVLVLNPWVVPTDQMSYTVEITDSAKYQELIQKGYTFSRVYENREIYIIKGDELTCE